jgi:hypothetical protein
VHRSKNAEQLLKLLKNCKGSHQPENGENENVEASCIHRAEKRRDRGMKSELSTTSVIVALDEKHNNRVFQ